MKRAASRFDCPRAAVRSLWLALALASGIAPAALGATPAAATEAAASVPTGAPNEATLAALESLGRARPDDAAAKLQRLLPLTAAHSALRLELLTVQGMALAMASQADAAERSAAQLEAWGRDRDAPLAPSASAAASLIRARAMARGGNLERADTLMQEAITLLPASVSTRARFRFVWTHAFIKSEAGKLEAAVRLGHEALALADRIDERWMQSESRTTLAISYCDAKQLERARTLNLAALTLAESAQDEVALSRGHTAAGIILDGMGDVQGERRSFELALDHARHAGSKIDEVRLLANMADFFLKIGDYKTALVHAERALPLARELNDASSETVAVANIGLAHIAMQHFEIGKRYVRQATEMDERRGSLTGVSGMYRELGLYLERAGDLPGAIAAYHAHRRLDTTILQGDQQKAILAMQEQYDADGRTRALALLNRENDIKAEQLRRRNLQQRLWWLLAATFVLSFAVVAMLYRRVRETNRMLSTSNELLKVQSECDPLTGLANRRHFQAVMRRMAADGKLNGTVFLIDIDHFKTINDRHGHSAGDAVLIEVARRLRETLREQDLIVRWGGEEFLVVVQSLAPDQVDALAQRMLGALDRTPIVCGAQRIAVTASIGFATFPIGPLPLRVSWERAINLVDTAMYLAKAHGRNRAYGVRLLHARDETQLDEITRSLEAAWRDGQVALTLLQGSMATEAVA